MTKILLVEDDKSLREIYGVRLLAEGYDIVSAGDGEEALAMAIKDRPALIISDVMMPKISGFDMLDILRSTTETRNIKVIMMTALSSEDQRKRGEQLGADRYLVKSQVGIEDVVHTVHEVLEDAPVSQPVAQPFTPAGGQANAAQQPQMAAPRPINVPPARLVAQDAYAAPAAPAAIDQPAAMTTPVQPQQPPVQQSDLPQPTAPFSTPRPSNLASRVIEPLERPETNEPHVGDLMERELGANATDSQPAAPATQQPTVPEAPGIQTAPVFAQPAAISSAPLQAPVYNPVVPAPEPPAAPSMPQPPFPPQTPPQNGMDYETTPVNTSQQ